MGVRRGLIGDLETRSLAVAVGLAAVALAPAAGALPGAPFVVAARAQGATGGTLGPPVLDAARAQTLSGGTSAPVAPASGGSEYGIVPAVARSHAKPAHPTARRPSRRRPSARRPAPRTRLPVKPRAPSPPVPPATTPLPAGTPTPLQTVAGAVFPVQGPHSYGDAANRFGASRAGHVHQGQDVLAAEGTPVVAPLAGTITATGYQAGGAGYYVVERLADGFELMFAHCQAGTPAVGGGQTVAAGQALCRVGQTGDATGPHLHFEMWVGGWQAPGGQPIDPLPYLQAWEAGGG
jgi:murein DD-endopeptidase MepM/ murein hydrolase activator NlpD